LSVAQSLNAQIARSSKVSKGPRATALLQLPVKGAARLIPVCIMIDGRFFDAGIYKADPVPMALETGTVYEAQQTGKPLGLFTVKNVLQQQQSKAWLAEGDWEAAGSAPKKSTTLQAESKPREEEDRPPTLRRPAKPNPESKPGETKASGPEDGKPASSGPPQPATPSSTSGAPSTPPDASSPNPSPNAASKSSSGPPAAQPTPAEESDPNAPRLRRGIPPKTATASVTSGKAVAGVKTAPVSAKPEVAAGSPAVKPSVQLIPAISDADGPEPRPYTYDMQPEEEQGFRKKILQLAGPEVINYARQFEAVQEAPTRAQRKGRSTSASSPNFTDVRLRVFDISTSNEPIIVMTAKALLSPESRKDASENLREYYVTLVARTDYNNELRKLFSAVTDNRHLDVAPRMELIDAVDADGDGRAELLFRENFDGGSAFVVYRVTPDRLWALFEGTPQ
jgi:hypothetical protein